LGQGEVHAEPGGGGKREEAEAVLLEEDLEGQAGVVHVEYMEGVLDGKLEVFVGRREDVLKR
jgi:hypothetical protein